MSASHLLARGTRESGVPSPCVFFVLLSTGAKAGAPLEQLWWRRRMQPRSCLTQEDAGEMHSSEGRAKSSAEALPALA